MIANPRISNAYGATRSGLFHRDLCIRGAPAPYPHLRLYPVLGPTLAKRVLCWLQGADAWQRDVRSFSRHDSFALTPAIVPTEAGSAVSPRLLMAMRGELRSRLQVDLKPFAWIEAHRSTKRDRIGIHTDEGVNEVRVALNLNSGWTEGRGGLLSLQDRPVGPRKRVEYSPFHNSATAFRTTPTSYHRVSPINGGRRYTLLYRFPIAETPRIDPERDPCRASPSDLAHAQESHTVIVVISDPHPWAAN